MLISEMVEKHGRFEQLVEDVMYEFFDNGLVA